MNCNVIKLTKLVVGIVGADMIAATEQPFHYERSSHGIENSKVLWYSVVLETIYLFLSTIQKFIKYLTLFDITN